MIAGLITVPLLTVSIKSFVVCCLLFAQASFAASIRFETRMENVQWQTESSKFGCRLFHTIEGFGEAVFEREAGEDTRFYLNSKTPRLKTGQAALVARAPAWSVRSGKVDLGLVKVKESLEPVSVGRQLAERMLAELQKGYLLDINRRPWYGDSQSLQVTVSSIGFFDSHSEYLNCLSGLLPFNFGQLERSSFNYENEDKDLTEAAKRRLNDLIAYVKEDESVQAIYLDGHTDSEGIRSENMLKAKERTERVMNYLLERNVPETMIVARWHGERYKLVSNRTAKGRATNRRVTVRLSKKEPNRPQMPKDKMMQDKAMNADETMPNPETMQKKPTV